MKIAAIKSYAWKAFEKNDTSIGFEFKGKHIIYPWLDFEKQAFCLTTIEAIAEYGYKNIKQFCEEVAPLCDGRTDNVYEWSGDDEITDTTKWAYNRWLEDEVLYIDGKIMNLSF